MRALSQRTGRRCPRRVLDWLKEVGTYLLPTGIFVLLSACGFALVVGLGGEWLEAARGRCGACAPKGGGALDFTTATALVLGAGFVGAYIWSIDYLILRIATLDLSLLSFLRTSGHVLMTVFVAWVLCQVVAAPGIQEKLAVAVILGIAFLSGLYSVARPQCADRSSAPLAAVEGRAAGGRDLLIILLDLIDGIDPSIRFRLNQLEIAEVQNLATANPILLYVEAPYGLLEVIDWLAVAQLLAELGPERFLHARSGGIRDMGAFWSSAGARRDAGFSRRQPLAQPEASDAAVQATFDSIAKKLHVQHLHRWSTVISQALDAPAKGAHITRSRVRRTGRRRDPRKANAR